MYIYMYIYISLYVWVLQQLTKCLRLTLVFLRNSTEQEKFSCCFQEFSASINKIFILAGRLGTRLSCYEV